jgi:hypothetical protein
MFIQEVEGRKGRWKKQKQLKLCRVPKHQKRQTDFKKKKVNKERSKNCVVNWLGAYFCFR